MSADDEIIANEDAIIGVYLAPLTQADEGAFGLSDDCAVLTPEPGTELVLNTDSLVEGVHFLPGDLPSFKALAINVSDLIAKGATPRAYLMNLALPAAPTRGFMVRLVAGLDEAQTAFGCHLIGGDTDRTPGPFTITITAIGTIPIGRTVRRSGGRPGDVLLVTGTIGDATLGLSLRRQPALARTAGLDSTASGALVARFDAPMPNVATALLVRDFASAAMDVSDGLVKDLERLARASGCGAKIDAAAVPLSQPARQLLRSGAVALENLLSGGEDYEVLCAMPRAHVSQARSAAATMGLSFTEIGVLTEPSDKVQWQGPDGLPMAFKSPGWDHFGGKA